MGELTGRGAGPDGEGEIGRRCFIAGAAAAGGLAFTVPAIVTMKPAGASTLTSPPPKPPDTPGDSVAPADIENPPVQVRGEVATVPTGRADDPAVAPVVAAGQLPFTGANVKEMLAAGLAATSAGAAMVLWSAERAKDAPPEATPPTAA